MTRTSMGPNGRNKMVINHLEKLFVTSDAATIIKELEVVHPAAKLLVLASQQQEAEMGDQTNFVVIFAGELLQQAEYLLKMGLHPSEVIEGFDIALKKTMEILQTISVDTMANGLKLEELVKVVRPAIAAKQYGYEDLLSELVVKAALEVMPKNANQFNVDSVRVVKILGGSIHDSAVVKGMVFGREPEGVVTNVTKAKIAIFSCGIDVALTETKGTVLIHNAQEMLNFSKGEEKKLEDAIKELADAGVKVVVSGSGIGELALHFLNRYNMMVVKVLSKFDLRRLCKATQATALTRLGVPTAEEMGWCDIVESVEIGSDRCTVFRQEEETSRTATIVLRGGTMNTLDDLERAVDDGVNVIKASVKDPRLVPGAGATEIELARKLQELAERTPGLNQYSIKKYAEAFEVIPRTLSDNAGLDSTEVLSKLYAAHQTEKISMGVDIESEDNGVLDAKEAGIFDVLSIKQMAIRLATNAAITILSVDQIIMSKPAGGPKVKENKEWDEDYIALELKGIQYENRPVNLLKGEQNSEDFTEINPNNTIPVFEWNGHRFHQSLAILEFLEEVHPDIPLLPKDPFERAKVRSVVGLICCDIHPIQNLRVLKKVGDAEKMEWGKFWITRGFDALEKLLSDGFASKYCVGDELTLADACLVPQYYNAVRFGVDLSAYPAINRIHETLSSLDAFKKAHASAQPDATA
ncbi:T-complex protein 1 subunit theta [Dinochytrium kinnereticum]|nr:T-complex protein 1 subunit theta [Dinochytrium kinnereticum]